MKNSLSLGTLKHKTTLPGELVESALPEQLNRNL